MRTTRKNTLTLIELLIVVAIIAMLIAILLPGLQRAKRMAIIAACQSNMKQIGSMIHLYAADCRGYVIMPGSAHRISVDGWGDEGRGGYHLAQMTTEGYNIPPHDVTPKRKPFGELCPLGDKRLYPVSFGWFYAMGYLKPSGDIGVLHCPGMGIFRGPDSRFPASRHWGVDEVTSHERQYNTYSRLTVDLARYDGKYNHSIYGGRWDCEPCAITSYYHRGWRRTDRPTSNDGVHRQSNRLYQWEPQEAVAVDWERFDSFDKWDGKFIDSHGDGLNILFADGSVRFGGRRIGGYEPFVYYGMTVGGGSYATASAVWNGAHSGQTATALGWNNGQLELWRYYESSQK
jgi:prepilin-type processing-associated H-X9-DG protein